MGMIDDYVYNLLPDVRDYVNNAVKICHFLKVSSNNLKNINDKVIVSLLLSSYITNNFLAKFYIESGITLEMIYKYIGVDNIYISKIKTENEDYKPFSIYITKYGEFYSDLAEYITVDFIERKICSRDNTNSKVLEDIYEEFNRGSNLPSSFYSFAIETINNKVYKKYPLINKDIIHDMYSFYLGYLTKGKTKKYATLFGILKSYIKYSNVGNNIFCDYFYYNNLKDDNVSEEKFSCFESFDEIFGCFLNENSDIYSLYEAVRNEYKDDSDVLSGADLDNPFYDKTLREYHSFIRWIIDYSYMYNVVSTYYNIINNNDKTKRIELCFLFDRIQDDYPGYNYLYSLYNNGKRNEIDSYFGTDWNQKKLSTFELYDLTREYKNFDEDEICKKYVHELCDKTGIDKRIVNYELETYERYIPGVTVIDDISILDRIKMVNELEIPVIDVNDSLSFANYSALLKEANLFMSYKFNKIIEKGSGVRTLSNLAKLTERLGENKKKHINIYNDDTVKELIQTINDQKVKLKQDINEFIELKTYVEACRYKNATLIAGIVRFVDDVINNIIDISGSKIDKNSIILLVNNIKDNLLIANKMYEDVLSNILNILAVDHDIIFKLDVALNTLVPNSITDNAFTVEMQNNNYCYKTLDDIVKYIDCVVKDDERGINKRKKRIDKIAKKYNK